jgi:hypothetical protein
VENYFVISIWEIRPVALPVDSELHAQKSRQLGLIPVYLGQLFLPGAAIHPEPELFILLGKERAAA